MTEKQTEGGAANGASPPKGSGGGIKFKLGEYIDVFEAVRESINANQTNLQGAAQIGICLHSYRLLKAMLLLRELPKLEQQHKAKLDAIAEQVETHRQINLDAQKYIGALYKQYKTSIPKIKPKTKRHQAAETKQRQRRLESTLLAINVTCETTKEMELPNDLSAKDRQEAIKTLAASMELIVQLQLRLLGDKQ